MKSVLIIDPRTNEVYPHFIHNTTTYWNIPHGRESALVFDWDDPGQLCIESRGEKIMCAETKNGQARISLHDLPSPDQPHRISGFIKELFGKRGSHCQQRLYNFLVEVTDPSDGDRILSRSEFHILCPADFKFAESEHVLRYQEPNTNIAQTIADCSEGHGCAHCKDVKKSLR